MSEEKNDGLVGIVEGEVVVSNPQAGGRYAFLYPPEENVLISVNGKEIEEQKGVKEEDIIEIIPLKLAEEARVELRVSPDGLSAEIAVHPRIISTFYLKDMELCASLKPVVGKKEHRENVLTLLDAMEELKKNNVVYGIDKTALEDVIGNAEGVFKTIARGKKAREGRDGYIEFLVDPETEAIVYGEKEQKVDYRERFRFPEVREGDLIAVIHPAVSGVPGYKVSGETIQPDPVKNITVRYGEGVDEGGNKSEVIASKNGRLMVKGNLMKVINLLVHSGDVDLESGNIRFNGDVHIYGSIQERMIVEARGDLFVEGSGFGATVRAGGGIQFTKNIIKCRVEGGLYFAFLKKLIPIMEKLAEQLGGIIINIEKVAKGISNRGQKVDDSTLTLIARSVTEKASPHLRENVALLEQLLSKEKFLFKNESLGLSSLKEFLPLLKEKTFYQGINSMEALSAIEKNITGVLHKLMEQSGDPPVFSASYIQNSDICFGGEINVDGPGSYLSDFKAGEGVSIHGVFRGGSIEAHGDVKVKEFVFFASAAESLAKKPAIRIKVPAQNTIVFNKVHVDTTVQVGKYVYRFNKESERVKVSYNSEIGMLQVTGF